MNATVASIQPSPVPLQSVPIEETVNIQRFPLCPKDHFVKSHHCDWTDEIFLTWSHDKIQLVPATGQVGDMVNVFSAERILNANMLRIMESSLQPLPELWFGRCLYFPATIFTLNNGRPYILMLSVSEAGSKSVEQAMLADRLKPKSYVALYNL